MRSSSEEMQGNQKRAATGAASREASANNHSKSARLWGMLGEAMPADFYDVKREVTPKAPPKAMWAMAALAYVPTLAVFLALVVYETGVTSTETIVTSEDLSDGKWTCSMISKVTESVALGSNASFGLYAVLESQGECESNLLGSDSFDCEGSLDLQQLVLTATSADFLRTPRGVATDALGDNVYVVDYDNGELSKIETATGSVTTLMDSTYLSYPYGVAVDAQGDNVYVVDNGNDELYKYETATGSVENLQNYGAGTVGWFICEGEAQSSVPSTSSEALSACSRNGISWQMDFSGGGPYFFSADALAAHYTAAAASSGCSDANLRTICDYVGDLPPYSCERKVSKGVYDVIGTAVANAELFYLILLTILARLLFLFKTGGDPTSKSASASDSASSAEEGVELGTAEGRSKLNGEYTLPPQFGNNKSSDRELIQMLANEHAKLANDFAKLASEHAELKLSVYGLGTSDDLATTGSSTGCI